MTHWPFYIQIVTSLFRPNVAVIVKSYRGTQFFFKNGALDVVSHEVLQSPMRIEIYLEDFVK